MENGSPLIEILRQQQVLCFPSLGITELVWIEICGIHLQASFKVSDISIYQDKSDKEKSAWALKLDLKWDPLVLNKSTPSPTPPALVSWNESRAVLHCFSSGQPCNSQHAEMNKGDDKHTENSCIKTISHFKMSKHTKWGITSNCLH